MEDYMKTKQEISQYNKEYYNKNKDYFYSKANISRIRNQNFIFEIKKQAKCKICQFNKTECLEFHHKNIKEKTHNISEMVLHGFALDKIKKEIEKCDIICRNCHKDIHYKNIKPKGKMLKIFSYKKKNCICQKCNKKYKPHLLEFHHLYNKNFTISHHKNKSWEDIILEIKKCIILCGNCHRLEHVKCFHIENKKIYLKIPIKEKIRKKENKYKKCINCEKKCLSKSIRCKSCAGVFKTKDKSKRPAKEQLKQDFINLKSYCGVGRKYGVSDNAVRKWCKYYASLI